MGRMSKTDYYLNIALAVSKRSTCLKRHYGCVIVKDDEIVATGYNGSPRGESNCCDVGICKREDCERYSGYEHCCAVHAEQNALVAADYHKLKDSIVYLACEPNINIPHIALEDENPVPCNICAKMLKNAGVAKVYNKKGEVKL